MIAAVRDRIDRYLGRGRHSIAVPVMDGALHPNNAIEEAALVLSAPGLDNLCAQGGDLWFSVGAALMHRPAGGAPASVAEFDAPITCLALAPDGALAIGLDGRGIAIRGGAQDGRRIETLSGRPLRCPTAAVFADAGSLIITIGAQGRLAADWKRDLMAGGATGEVWRIDLASGTAARLAGCLAWPCGVCVTAQGLAVSEAWAHRLILIEGGKTTPVLADLPAYPARIAALAEGGHALALFAPRNQLTEFILREPEILGAMTREVHPDNWVGPKLLWGQGFKEPMQAAALKTMGIIKPWAPTWSYGLVVQLDETFRPVASFHSRADGRRHGITSVCEAGGRILAGSKGAGEIVALEPKTVRGTA